MTPQEYRSTLKRLGYTQESAAKVFGYSGREGQRWCSLKGDGPPKAVAMLVKAQEENRRLQTQVLLLGEVINQTEGLTLSDYWVQPNEDSYSAWARVRRAMHNKRMGL